MEEAKEYEKTLKPGEILFKEGDVGEEMYLIKSGKIKISKGGGDIEKTVSAAFSDKRQESTAMGADSPHIGLGQNLCNQLCLIFFGPKGLQQLCNCPHQVIDSNSQN